MATSAASLILPQPLPAALPLLANPSTPNTNPLAGLFQAALAIANGQLIGGATAASDAAIAAASEQGVLLEDTPSEDDEAVATALSLPGTAPLLIHVPATQDAAITAIPGTFTGVTNRLPAGTTLPAAPPETLSRAEQLRLQQTTTAAQTNQQLPLPRPNALPAVDITAEQPAIASPTPAVTTAQRNAATANPEVVNAPLKGSVVPAQVPLVAGLLPNAQAASQLSPTGELPAPIVTSAAAGLPSTQVGDRPATAGERFAAIATAGARLLNSPADLPAVFTQVLRHEIPIAARENVGDRFIRHAADMSGSVGGAAGIPQTLTQAVTAQQAVAPVFRTPATQVADEVVAHARVLERDGSVEFRLQLDPPDLGRVRVHLISAGDEVRGQVIVADDAVRRMIESQLPELRQRLEAAGVNVQQFDITADTRGGNRNPYRNDTPNLGFQNPLPPALAMPRPPPNRSTSGSVDVTV